MASSNISVNLSPNEELIVSSKRKQKYSIPFTPIGKKSMKRPESIDALKCIGNFTKPELALVLLVSDTLQAGNKLAIKPNERTQAETLQLGKGIRSWLKKGLIKRIQREHYMVNPWFLVPSNADDQIIAIAEWDNL